MSKISNKYNLSPGIILGVILAGLVLSAGFQEASAGRTGKKTAGGVRIVTDLQGNRVRLSRAAQLERVVIIAPPMVSTFVSLGICRTKIVGAHRIAFADANKKLLDIALPYWRQIPTGFLTGYQSNTEELLKLDPDLVLIYGNLQKKGLEGAGLPVLDFYLQNQDNEAWSVAIENLMREIFETGDRVSPLQDEWDWAKKKAAILLSAIDGPKKRGLMIMSNTGNKICVRGKGSYGDDWLKKSGLVNVADIHGDNKEVSMEQLYAWNPDIIYVFRGIPASGYPKIPNQDWRHINAVRNSRIYDTPRGLINWGAPNADSPLMLLWMVSKNYPHLLSDAAFSRIMKDYYFRRYGIALNEELIQTTLYPNGK